MFNEKVDNIESIANMHDETINKFSTSQSQFQHKFQQDFLGKFFKVEVLQIQINNTKNEMEETVTAKIEEELENQDNDIETSSAKLKSCKHHKLSSTKLLTLQINLTG